jgi:hypothetical protein
MSFFEEEEGFSEQFGLVDRSVFRQFVVDWGCEDKRLCIEKFCVISR